MIPKIIHYVWVGEKEKPEIVLKCIDSWKKYCPDYEYIEWNNNAVNKIDNLYMKQAFDNKKWAFVSDYLRLYALYQYGGLYFDTDLELTNKLDSFLDLNFFSGYEKYNNNVLPITALMAASRKNKIIKDLLEEYNDIPFIKDDKMDLTTNTSRISLYFKNKFNLKKPYNPNEKVILCEKSVIFPGYFFNYKEDNKENYSIHHYNGSWLEGYSRKIIFKFKNYKLVRFHKRKNVKNTLLPLLHNEKIIKIISVLSYKIVLIKSCNKN